MKLLDRYLLILFSKKFLLILGSLTTVYMLVDFFERIDNFIEKGKPFSLAIKYFLFKIPTMIDLLLPVCILLAGIITLGLLNHNHEFSALKACGVSATRIIYPILIGSIAFTVFHLVIAQWLLPATASVSNKIWYEEVSEDVPTGISRNDRTFHRGNEGVYSFIQPDLKKYSFTDFSYASWEENYRPKLFLTADEASWQNNTWTFKNGRIKQRDAASEYTVEPFERTTFTLPETPGDFFVPIDVPNETSLSRLFKNARSRALRNDPGAWLAFHQRLSYVFLGIPLILLGIPVLFAVHQRWGHDLVFAVPISCGLAFAAWGWWSVAQSLAKASYLPAIAASWNIHLLLGTAGWLLIRRQDR